MGCVTNVVEVNNREVSVTLTTHAPFRWIEKGLLSLIFRRVQINILICDIGKVLFVLGQDCF